VRRPIVLALVLVGALALPAAPASATTVTIRATCKTFDYRGFEASDITGTDLFCKQIKRLVKHVIVHGTGYLSYDGWKCSDHGVASGHGSAACRMGSKQFRFRFRLV
jgi:hypothetical protein